MTTRQQEREYTWEDLEKAVGQDFSGGVIVKGADKVDEGWIRRFCEVLEMDCPLFHDDKVAKAHGYKGIPAPISMINSTLTRPAAWKPGQPSQWPDADVNRVFGPQPEESRVVPLPKPKTTRGFATDIEIEYLKPVYAGDQLEVRGRKLVNVTVRETSVGFGAFTISESEIYNQRGEKVAVQRNGGYAYNPKAK